MLIRFGKYLPMSFAVCCVLSGVTPAPAQQSYPESGRVFSATENHGYVYMVDTSDKVYELMCTNKGFLHWDPCTIAGKSIAVNDTVRFREKGDTAYMPGKGNGEQKLTILSTELKILPQIPMVPGREAGAVLGLGMEVQRSRGGASSPGPTGPVTAIPVTGGPPVQVIPTGPVGGGTVTGVPTTGGPPITAIPVAPVSNTSASGGSTWIHFVRVETSSYIYDLACTSRSCSLDHQPIQLGDLLAIRVEKKAAYLSRVNAGTGNESKFHILRVRKAGDPTPD